MEINSINVNDALRKVANVADMLSSKDVSKDNNKDPKDGDSYNSSQPQHQVVQVQVGDPEAKDKQPTIVKKKHEKHIHNDFPETRALTDAECELALKRTMLEHELKLKELEYNHEREDIRRKDRLEREERERKQNAEVDKTAGNVFKWIFGSLAAVGVGWFGYRCVKYIHNGKNSPVHPTNAAINSGTVQTEATIE